MQALYAGLMSGTSLDGVDAVLADLSAGRVKVIGHAYLAFPEALRAELLALNQPGDNEIHRAALAGNALARAYHQALLALLSAHGVAPVDVKALGAHGQTVRHRPGEFDATGYTVQLLNGALLAELTGIDVVCDFRSRDVAAGGQGAPLVPGFHAAVFAQPGLDQAVLNLGGIGNLTLLTADGGVSGFDCGPGNALMDLWCLRHLGQHFDRNGAWAAQGRADTRLLATLLSEPFLHRRPPKSTGRDLFNAAWLDRQLFAHGLADTVDPVDVQATLCDYTVQSAVQALRQHLPSATRLLVCGGGALNLELMRRLRAQLGGLAVEATDAVGLPAMQVEAAAFAWLAQAHLTRQPGNRPAVTGAAGWRVLGAHHPAHLGT